MKRKIILAVILSLLAWATVWYFIQCIINGSTNGWNFDTIIALIFASFYMCVMIVIAFVIPVERKIKKN